ncbi:hypothetical protein B0H17DRAFT_1095035 [Mycena rosella]|uniref:Uncharacterized protein n=1 Tax=Mycena rosella TaxID=1033263 RepID=A0AAD7CSF8_MYCRO|nr:hypothetical protein B0H17DRAFT_1103564 [Mycena rosella]KAJ7660615.1 hypothetical protein B0H17DRAFT_1095035 [Mycena rosella]
MPVRSSGSEASRPWPLVLMSTTRHTSSRVGCPARLEKRWRSQAVGVQGRVDCGTCRLWNLPRAAGMRR